MPVAAEGIVRIEHEAALEFHFCACPIPVVPGIRCGEGLVSTRELVVKFESLCGGRFPVGKRLLGGNNAIRAPNEIGISQARVGGCTRLSYSGA